MAASLLAPARVEGGRSHAKSARDSGVCLAATTATQHSAATRIMYVPRLLRPDAAHVAITLQDGLVTLLIAFIAKAANKRSKQEGQEEFWKLQKNTMVYVYKKATSAFPWRCATRRASRASPAAPRTSVACGH